MSWRARDRWSRYKDYEHECQIMRSLQKVTTAHVPNCVALCYDQGGRAVLVMDLVTGARTLNTALSQGSGEPLSEEALYLTGHRVYKSTMAMLGSPVYKTGSGGMADEGITNVDQTGANIMVQPDGEVHFIDMGMAMRPSESRAMCDGGKNRNFRVLKTLKPLLGAERACDLHLEWQFVNTVGATLGALPRESEAAMHGLVDAFCEEPHNELTRTRYEMITLRKDGSDPLFAAAFLGKKNILDEVVESPLFVKRDHAWYKVGDAAVRVSNGSPKTSAIPDGAKLAAVKCQSEYKQEDMRYWDLGRRGSDLCAGDYLFILENVPMVAENVLSILKHVKAPGLMEQALKCAR